MNRRFQGGDLARRLLAGDPVTGMVPLPVPWTHLAQAALDRDLLDAVDLTLIRTLTRRAGRPGDEPLQAVLGGLLSAVRGGALRIPAAERPLAVRLEDFLRSLRYDPAPGAFQAPGSLPDPAALASAIARDFHAAWRGGAYGLLIGESTPAGDAPFLPLIHRGGGLYFQRHHAAESRAGLRLAALLAAPDLDLPAAEARAILSTVLDRFPLRAGTGTGPNAPPMVFRDGQKLALALALRKRFAVISGGPGTGKTSLVANLLRAKLRLPADPARPLRIRLAAPTGRAAQRVTESLRKSLAGIAYGAPFAGPAETPDPVTDPGAMSDTASMASSLAAAEAEAALDRPLHHLAGETLHRLLRYNPGSGEWFHRKDRPLPADLVVVDEVSMVDIFALARLVDALEEGATLVLLGDMDQLPSVEAGAVLADLVPGPEAYTFSDAEAARLAALLPGDKLALPQGPGPAPLRDHLVVLDRSHRSEAGILKVASLVNAMDGMGALISMEATVGAAAATGASAEVGAKGRGLESPWPVTYLEVGPKPHQGPGPLRGRTVTPGGGCRMIDVATATETPAPAAPADLATPPTQTPAPSDPGRAPQRGSGFPMGLPALIESWVDFNFLGHPQNPASHPDRVLAAPRSASYAALVEKLAALPLDAAGTPAWNALLEEAFAYLDQARILTFTRKGWHGSESLNARIRDKLAPLWDPRAAGVRGTSGRVEAFHGAPILIQENDYGKDLFNGEVGLHIRHRGRAMAWFRKEDGFRSFPAAFLPRHELAFASTVHKAQGSEYDQVLIILPEAGNRLLYKETLYTAITRARRFAAVFGPREVFLEAIHRKVVRESGLRDFLATVNPG